MCVATMVHPTARFFFFFSPCMAFIGSKRNTACPVVPRCHCDDDDLDLVCQYFDYDCTTKVLLQVRLPRSFATVLDARPVGSESL